MRVSVKFNCVNVSFESYDAELNRVFTLCMGTLTNVLEALRKENVSGVGTPVKDSDGSCVGYVSVEKG